MTAIAHRVFHMTNLNLLESSRYGLNCLLIGNIEMVERHLTACVSDVVTVNELEKVSQAKAALETKHAEASMGVSPLKA